MSKLRGWRWGLRSKFLLLLVLLLPLPWFGYRYVRELETTLQAGQQQVVASLAQALALTLGDKPELFNNNSNNAAAASGRLYVYPLAITPDVHDGSLDDWQDYRRHELALQEGSTTPWGGNRYSSFRSANPGGDLLELRLLLGEAGGSLYLYVRVVDALPVLANSTAVAVEATDALVLSLVGADGTAGSYRITPIGGGAITAWQMPDDTRDSEAWSSDPRITGRFTQTPQGYEYELQLPVALAERWLALAVEDVDDRTNGSLAAIVASGDLDATATAIQRPANELERLLAMQRLGNFRVRVYDRGMRLLYQSGELGTASGVLLPPLPTAESGAMLQRWRQRLLHPLYDRLWRWMERQSAVPVLATAELDSAQLLAALNGSAQSGYRTDSSLGLRSLEAAWPLMVGEAVAGAVVVDHNLDGLRSARNQSLAALFDAMLAIVLVTMVVMLVFAGNLSKRVRALREQADFSIDPQGRLAKPLEPSRSNDELGELSRSIAHMLERLGHYNQYLENLTGRLSHELRTPVTVVRSSLENLALLNHSDPEAELYLRRAEDGISRLNLILTNMSEATRLEQLLRGCEKVPVAVAPLLHACLAQYRQIYPAAVFESAITASPLPVLGSAEHLVQLLDKIVANAVEFSDKGHAIGLTCQQELGEAVISVTNRGPTLDPAMRDRLFDSMVSVRPQGNRGVPHLGLGLHIARLVTEFHAGSIYAENLLAGDGVIVVVRLPLLLSPA